METSATASEVISFAEKLEGNSSMFYQELAKKYVEGRDMFLSFAKESIDNKTLVSRTYQETITDAIEACFSFRGLNLNNYSSRTALEKDASYSDALRVAIELEEKACSFWMDATEHSKSLLATIPRVFRKVAERRSNRISKMNAVLESL
jgi:rubrerythrin